LHIPQQTTIGKPDVAFLSTSLTSINLWDMQALKLMKDRDRKQEGGGEGKQRDIIFKLVRCDINQLEISLSSILFLPST
jgi:hypothetical protein